MPCPQYFNIAKGNNDNGFDDRFDLMILYLKGEFKKKKKSNYDLENKENWIKWFNTDVKNSSNYHLNLYFKGNTFKDLNVSDVKESLSNPFPKELKNTNIENLSKYLEEINKIIKDRGEKIAEDLKNKLNGS